MKFSRFLAVLAMLLLASVSVFAQSTTTGALTGTVTSDGAPLPGATVTVTSPQGMGARTAVSDANGNYNIPALPPGDYTVRVELQGLQTVTRTTRVTLTGTTRVDADLRVSAVTESITVTASAPAALETQEIQTNFDADVVENLPVARTLIGTVNLAPGVTQNGPGGATVISGGFAYDSTYTVDGAVVNEVLRGQPQNLFIEDAIQETTVQTGAISAEFGRFTGGVVSAITKSGGNEFTGSLRDSINNPEWTEQGILNEARPASKLVNIYEGTLGGYLMRDRLWFFTAGRYYELESQRFFATTGTPGEQAIPYLGADEERRFEIKLTGQVTPRHTLVGTYFDIAREQINSPGPLTPAEAKTLDAQRTLPNTFRTFNYNGVITDNFLIEASYAEQDFSFVDSGADAPATPERGTNISFPGGRRAGYPTFCGACSFPEERNNLNGRLKGSYFLSSGALGTHNLTAGYERYEDMLKSDNHQSASDFSLLVYTNFLNTDPTPGLTRGANGELLGSVKQGGALILWWPILESAQGNSFRTDSLFLNDKWDFNQNLSFNLGVRYDQNKGENNAGLSVADDSNISPRLGVTYDIFGNGRLRANASYSVYSSKVANGNVGDASSTAGSPSYLYWVYYGPDIINQNTDTILDQVYSWFRSVGFTENRDFFLGGGSNGIQTQIRDPLQSQSVDEFTVGIGGQIGANGFLRVDYQDRTWDNFYTTRVDQSTGQVYDPLADAEVDLNLVENSDDFERHYQAFLLQGSYRLFNRFNLGANYTYSTLKGNIEGETAASGPVTAAGSNVYPELLGYAQRFPVGYLLQDQRHKARAWVSYDQPTPFGTFNLSVLQRFDSGTPYSAIGTVRVTNSATLCPSCPSVPSYYNSVGPTSTYYFGERGQFRLDDIHTTDVALNYNLPISRVNLFVQGELLNAFNTQEVITPNTTVNVIRSTNPFTGTYVECTQGLTAAQCRAEAGHNDVGIWQKGSNFGKGLNPTTGSSLLPGGAAGSYNLPRTYRFSFGVRF
ncbi:MAG TPA: TonB-dependent receptor [Thermoanaerobaculia bacterium]|jgi:outer membrane receptor protein involved in Fe transport